MDIDHLRSWIGCREVRDQDIAPFPADAMAGPLDRPDRPRDGGPLPLPWHWLHFLETPGRSQIGPDGHPRKGGFLPPVPLARRMWAAGDLRIHKPLIIGHPARRISQVTDVGLKDGKSGPRVFVTLHHEILQDEVCLSEEQTIVYRAMPSMPAPLQLDLLYRQHSGMVPSRFSFRAVRPAFDGRPLILAGRTTDGGRRAVDCR